MGGECGWSFGDCANIHSSRGLVKLRFYALSSRGSTFGEKLSIDLESKNS